MEKEKTWMITYSSLEAPTIISEMVNSDKVLPRMIKDWGCDKVCEPRNKV